MMKTLRTITAVVVALLMLEGAGHAQQQYTYQVSVSDKTVNLAGLDLPGTTPLVDVLVLIPELLKNDDQSISSGQYDILVEGISVDCAANSVLSHLHLSDVKSIAISDSPTASQQRNGSGGVINITLKEVSEGLSGRASVNATTTANFHESAMLNYKKDKLTVRSWFMVDTSIPGFENEYRTLDTDNGRIYRIDTTRTHSNYQMGRILADYNPTAKDAIKLRVWESTQNAESIKNMQVVPTGENDSGGKNNSKSTTVSATLAYAHSFAPDKTLSAQFDYTWLPGRGSDQRRNPMWVNGEPSRKVETLNRVNNWTGAISYGMPVIKKEEKTILDFRTGVNLTVKDTYNEYSEKLNLASMLTRPSLDGDVVVKQNANSFYLSPYLELGGGWSRLKYKANIRYQYYQSSAIPIGEDDKVTSYRPAVTGNLSIGWQMPHQHIRLVFDRGIIRPSDWQMFPLLVYRPDEAIHILGNPQLAPSTLNSINLNYIADLHKGQSTFVINGSVGYVRANGLINPVYGVTNIGMMISYKSFDNTGFSDILKADLLCSYTNGPLMLALTTNFYHKHQKAGDKKDFRTYLNSSFCASYRISNDWTAFAELVYNSPVKMPTIDHSAYVSGDLRLSKSWARLEAFAAVTDILHKSRREVTKTSYMTTYRYYDLNATAVTLGLTYKF